jgi:hypothetical protein
MEELTLEQQCEVACKATGRKWSVDPFNTGVFADDADRTLWCPGTEYQLQRSQLYAVVELVARELKRLPHSNYRGDGLRLRFQNAIANAHVSDLMYMAWKLAVDEA